MRRELDLFGVDVSAEWEFLQEKGFSWEEILAIVPQTLNDERNPEKEIVYNVVMDYLGKDFFYSTCFGRVDLSGQDFYKDQHREWFQRSDTTLSVKYLKGKKAFLAHDILVLGEGRNSVAISVEALLECLEDDRGIYERVFCYQGDHSLRMKVLRDFLDWHFEKVCWGHREDGA